MRQLINQGRTVNFDLNTFPKGHGWSWIKAMFSLGLEETGEVARPERLPGMKWHDKSSGKPLRGRPVHHASRFTGVDTALLDSVLRSMTVSGKRSGDAQEAIPSVPEDSDISEHVRFRSERV